VEATVCQSPPLRSWICTSAPTRGGTTLPAIEARGRGPAVAADGGGGVVPPVPGSPVGGALRVAIEVKYAQVSSRFVAGGRGG
jgi:hypothetical protein